MTYVVEYEADGDIHAARVTTDEDEARETADALASEGLAVRIIVFEGEHV